MIIVAKSRPLCIASPIFILKHFIDTFTDWIIIDYKNMYFTICWVWEIQCLVNAVIFIPMNTFREMNTIDYKYTNIYRDWDSVWYSSLLHQFEATFLKNKTNQLCNSRRSNVQIWVIDRKCSWCLVVGNGGDKFILSKLDFPVNHSVVVIALI